MKVLFYSSYHATPHIETELEIAQGLIDKGFEVYFLQCKSELDICYANPEHTRIGCKLCISKVNNAYKRLNLPPDNFLSFPEIDRNKIDIGNEKITNISDLKRITYKGWDVGMAVASSLISYTRDHSPETSNYESYIEKGLKTAAYVFEVASKVLEILNPDEVYLFNGRFLEVRPFMRVCEWKGIRFYTHERGGVLNKYMLREGSIPHSLEAAKSEILSLWEEAGIEKEEIGRKFYEDRRNRVIQGWYNYTDSQSQNKLPINFDRDIENYVIFNSSMDEYEGIAGYTNPIYQDDNNAIERIVDAFKDDPTRHFYLRVHPNLKGLKNAQLRQIEDIALRYKNITVIAAEEDIDTYGLMENATKVLTFGSTMGIESVFWNKPVILLGRAFYEHLDCFYKPTSHDEVLELLKRGNLQTFNQYEALKYGYWCLNFGESYQHYRPTSVAKGVFSDKPVNPDFFWRALYVIQNKWKNGKS